MWVYFSKLVVTIRSHNNNKPPTKEKRTRMFIAITSEFEVLEISTSEASSLEGMSLYAKSHKSVRRVLTDAKAFTLWSEGKSLVSDLEVKDGIATTILIEKTW